MSRVTFTILCLTPRLFLMIYGGNQLSLRAENGSLSGELNIFLIRVLPTTDHRKTTPTSKRHLQIHCYSWAFTV